MTWKRGGYETATIFSDAMQPVQGYRNDLFGACKEGRLWAVTHLPSGWLVSRFKTLAAAKKAVAAVTPLLDWPRVRGSKKRPSHPAWRRAVKTLRKHGAIGVNEEKWQ